MKKAIAILLSSLLILSLPVTSFAAGADTDIGGFASKAAADVKNADSLSGIAKTAAKLLASITERLENVKISYDDLQKAVDEYSKIVMNVYGANGDFTSAQTVSSSGASSMSLKAMSRQLSKYLFIKLDGPEDIAALIAESCEFDYVVLDNGNGTIYIRVDVENNPQIFNYAVFYNLVEDLYEKQGEEMVLKGDGSVDYLMSYEHIAGELALHALIYAATKDIIKLTGTNSERILSLYNSAAQANLNVDEARVPAQFITFVGKLIINVVTYNFMRIFGMI